MKKPLSAGTQRPGGGWDFDFEGTYNTKWFTTYTNTRQYSAQNSVKKLYIQRSKMPLMQQPIKAFPQNGGWRVLSKKFHIKHAQGRVSHEASLHLTQP